MKKQFLLLIFVLAFSLFGFSQEITQTIKGKVYDSEMEMGLPGATIVIPGSDPLIGVTTDSEGYFRLEKVPVGRVDIQISFIGYESYFVSELLVSSGKEINLNIPLKESVEYLKGVVVTAEIQKEKPLNSMATVSARSFTVEQAQRFAGGMDDPSRLVSSFAGVTPSTVENNEIIIRGNAAKGILWRLEGVEIPPPNHLAGMFSGGGIITMFNSNMLANSDFFTGAFPAEYGNALSGVFDINLRNGNRDKREYTIQAGSCGIEFATEGPFKKGKQATYLVNYRYSTYSILKTFLPHVTGLPDFSDLSFKLNFPTAKAGTFSLWSINGMGKIDFEPEKDPEEWTTNYDAYNYDIHYDLTASGLNHRIIVGKKSYLFSSLSFSASKYTNNNSYLRSNLDEVPVSDQNEVNSRLSLSSYFNHKFNSRHTNRTGIVLSRLAFNYDVKGNSDVANSNTYDFLVNDKGSSASAQVYSESKYFINEKLNVNAGMHLLYFAFNKKFTVEPRVGFNWNFAPAHTFSLGYGKHSRIEPLRIYLMEVETPGGLEELNRDLKITKAHHFVLGYDWNINNYTHLKIEPYYQILYDVPVTPDSSFSMINYISETFFTEQLINDGTGRNIGVDVTLERFLKNGFYYMFTASVYNSKYKGGDGIERNTRYNQNFVFNLLGGKEWRVRENNIFSLNGKFTVLGGRRYAPVDNKKSIAEQFVIYDDSRIYEEQSPT
ncbi:MAG: TonB-dependent receptor, partial [Bacteroidales bacterium]|nr:TonB-dependent receptor [Bacteroidales bacterium]